MLNAASLAAILDPERKVQGWWKLAPTKCGNGSRDGVVDIFTGPPDLHTAREHCWRMEEWLEARGCWWQRYLPISFVYDSTDTTLSLNPNHAAALNAAIERISNEVR